METRNVKLVSTATTGLQDDDELLAVNIIEPEDAGSLSRTYFKRVDDRNKVIRAQEYHKITPETSMAGRPSESFVEAITNELSDSVVFTYNPLFQIKFLERQGIHVPAVYNLPLFLKGAEMRLLLFDDESRSLDSIESTLSKKAGAPQAFSKLTQSFGLTPSVIELPLQFSCRVLLEAWNRLKALPAKVQGTFL